MDLWTDRCVSREEGRTMAFDLGVSFYETSTRCHDQSVLRVFHDLVHQARCVRMRRDYEQQQRQQLQDSNLESKRGSGFARGVLGRLSFRSVKAKLSEMQILESNGLLDCNSQDTKEWFYGLNQRVFEWGNFQVSVINVWYPTGNIKPEE